MLFIERLIEKFKEYISRYDMTNENILNKYNHSIRVMRMAIKYSKDLSFNEEDIELAAIIGLLHDIGRFEQIQRTIANQELVKDEIEYGIKILFEDGIIKEFTDNELWYPIIRYAIKNHNKKEICYEGATERMIKHAKLIRDCDKLDIISGHAVSPYKVREADDSDISDRIREKFYREEQLDKSELKTNNERLLIKFAMVFDINYNQFFPDLKVAYEKYYKRVEHGNRFREYYEYVMGYIDKRMAYKDKNKRKR